MRAEIARLLPRRWRSALSADDVLQQTYTDAFLSVHGFVPGRAGGFAAWLRRIAENNLNDALRALSADKRGGGARRITSEHDQSSTGFLERLLGDATAGQSPTRALARRDADRVLEEALAKLPPAYQTVVREYDLNGRAMEEVAAQLGRSPGAAHLLRVRAHRRLRESLAGKTTVFRSLA